MTTITRATDPFYLGLVEQAGLLLDDAFAAGYKEGYEFKLADRVIAELSDSDRVQMLGHMAHQRAMRLAQDFLSEENEDTFTASCSIAHLLMDEMERQNIANTPDLLRGIVADEIKDAQHYMSFVPVKAPPACQGCAVILSFVNDPEYGGRWLCLNPDCNHDK